MEPTDSAESTGAGVVVVASRPADAGRQFELDPSSDPTVSPFLSDLEHEDELVSKLVGMGYKLTFVGGGSRPDETRRFYFRKR